ncbi:MAG TPA: histidine phosphatase family protein [Lachnospiraceae bacterium]|nr:histidine phosphatase family protein [Lachnospiraceae bacterium]
MNIYLIRHARQNSTLCNVNVELSEIGREQSKLLGRRLANYNLDVIYSSDLIRAHETASIANENMDLRHEVRQGLREIDFGYLQGETDENIAIKFGEFMRERSLMTSDIPFPGGECGQDVYNRAKVVLDEMIGEGYSNVAVVTHGGTIRSLLTGILGLEQARKLVFALSLENTSITQLVYRKETGSFYLERFNDYAHLEADSRLLRKNWK